MSNFKRDWMYKGNRPNGLTQFINRVYALVASAGLFPDWMVTLEVTGRKSGKLIVLPVVIGKKGPERYLVSMLGNSAGWVQNVRAAQGQAWIRSGRRREVRLEEVPVAQRAPIIKAYLRRAPGARPHVPISMDAPVEAFEAIAAEYPCFRIVWV